MHINTVMKSYFTTNGFNWNPPYVIADSFGSVFFPSARCGTFVSVGNFDGDGTMPNNSVYILHESTITHQGRILRRPTDNPAQKPLALPRHYTNQYLSSLEGGQDVYRNSMNLLPPKAVDPMLPR